MDDNLSHLSLFDVPKTMKEKTSTKYDEEAEQKEKSAQKVCKEKGRNEFEGNAE